MPDHNEPRLSEHLSNLRARGDGFRAPAPDYLDALADRALSAGKRQAPVRMIRQRWWAAAAAIALLLVGTVFWLRPLPEAAMAAGPSVDYNSEALLAELEAEDINAYISDQLEDFETELYATVSANE